MYAIANFINQQIKIEEGENTKIPFQDQKIGSKINLDSILFFDDGKKKHIGNPFIKSLSFTAEIISHGCENKILVYKKKRRKGYEKKNGHKQQFTTIKVDNFLTSKKEPKKKTVAKKKTSTKKTAKK